MEFDTVLFQLLLKEIGCIRVLSGKELFVFVYCRNLSTQSLEGLAELAPNGSATKDKE